MAQPVPTQIVVTDQNTQLQYSGAWLVDTSKPQNQIGVPGSLIPASSHKTSQPGSSFTFSFRGSTLGVVGSVFGNSSQAPVWGCSLDGASMTVHGAPAGPASWTFCDATVRDGPHNLTVTVDDPGPVGFWFGYLVYSPSVGVDISSHMYRIDRSDPSIVYSSGWNTLGGFANATTNSHSTLSVNFSGTAIDWMGYAPVELSHTPTVASYSIDGGSPVNFSIDGLPPDQTGSIYDQQLFAIRDLKPGNHSLEVTYLGDQSTAALALNYFNVLGSDVGGNSTPDPTSTSTGIPLGTQPPEPNPSEAPKSTHFPVGVIVGAVVGSVALLALAVGLFILRKRRRSAPGQQPLSNGQVERRARRSHVSPFTADITQFRGHDTKYASRADPPLALHSSGPDGSRIVTFNSYQNIPSQRVQSQTVSPLARSPSRTTPSIVIDPPRYSPS